MEETAVIDSAPVACVSYKRSKHSSDFAGTADYGVYLTGLIMGFLLTPTNS